MITSYLSIQFTSFIKAKNISLPNSFQSAVNIQLPLTSLLTVAFLKESECLILIDLLKVVQEISVIFSGVGD